MADENDKGRAPANLRFTPEGKAQADSMLAEFLQQQGQAQVTSEDERKLYEALAAESRQMDQMLSATHVRVEMKRQQQIRGLARAGLIGLGAAVFAWLIFG